MKARVRTDSLGNITVHIEGGLDFENCEPLRNQLSLLEAKNPSSDITIDLNHLDFVGSSGIGHFVETIKILKTRRVNLFFSNVKNEFQKVFKLYDFDVVEMMMGEFEAEESEMRTTGFGMRRNTFEN